LYSVSSSLEGLSNSRCLKVCRPIIETLSKIFLTTPMYMLLLMVTDKVCHPQLLYGGSVQGRRQVVY